VNLLTVLKLGSSAKQAVFVAIFRGSFNTVFGAVVKTTISKAKTKNEDRHFACDKNQGRSLSYSMF